MNMFLYLEKETCLHRLDPRTKLAMMVISFVLALTLQSLPGLLAVAVLILLYGMAGKTLGNLRRIRGVLMMIGIFSLVIWSLTGKGDTRIWGPFTWEGVLYGAAMGVKIDAMIIAGMIFLSCTKQEEISLALQKLHLPYRVAFAFSTALRLVPMIVATSYTIMQAQQSRGLNLDTGNVVVRAKKYIPLLIPVFVSVIRGTNIFAMALESKGFGYADSRSNFFGIQMQGKDWGLLVAGCCITAVAIYCKISWGW